MARDHVSSEPLLWGELVSFHQAGYEGTMSGYIMYFLCILPVKWRTERNFSVLCCLQTLQVILSSEIKEACALSTGRKSYLRCILPGSMYFFLLPRSWWSFIGRIWRKSIQTCEPSCHVWSAAVADFIYLYHTRLEFHIGSLIVNAFLHMQKIQLKNIHTSWFHHASRYREGDLCMIQAAKNLTNNML